MMEVVEYSKEYKPFLLRMLSTQRNSSIHPDYMEPLPELGFLILVATSICTADPLAAGFLRIVEGGFAQIDTLMSNADFPSDIRHQGVSIVVNRLIQEAKKQGLKALYAHTRDASTIKRAKSLGFRVIPETIISLSLQENNG
jgi:hypothetical protein